MGAFFTNVQLLAEGDSITLESVARALSLGLSEEGFIEASDDEHAHRTVLLRKRGRWIGVYDEATEGQNARVLRDLARRLSAALSTHAVSILVHDSDVLAMEAFDTGERVGELDTNPAFSGKDAPSSYPIEPWLPLLEHREAEGKLLQAFAEERLFAESTLAKLAKLFGIDPDAAALGYEYADKSDPGYTTLRFRHAEKPAFEMLEQGAPEFEMRAHIPALDVSAGSPFRVAYSVRNARGPGRGVDVCAWGPAVSDGLVTLSAVELVVGSPHAAGPSRPVASFETVPSEGGGTMLIATFDDIELPASVRGGASALGDLNAKALVEAMYRSNVHANITGSAIATGEAELFVGFVPHDARVDGRYGYETQLRSHPASRKPLKAKLGVEPADLRALDDGSTLFGLVSFDAPRTDIAELVSSVVERWGRQVLSEGGLTVGVFHANPGARPSTRKAKAAGFFDGSRWERLRSELASSAAVELSSMHADDPDVAAAWRSNGAAFGGSVIGSQSADPEDSECPTLALWCDVRDGSDARLAALRELLVQLMDDCIKDDRALQALVGCWNWTPSSLESTPYEIACGIHGQCTLQRSWLTRFIRGVTRDALWLGPALTDRIDRDALDTVADVRPVGDGVRIDIRETAPLDALEEALATLLPEEGDWFSAVDRYYGR